uniref:Uncharacterized protein n=1 Tax=Anguilla anguilla TaxID=7936 RepID=A0A0E9TH62_ANGAN
MLGLEDYSDTVHRLYPMTLQG